MKILMLFAGITPAFLDERRHVIEYHRLRVVGGISLRPLCPLCEAYFFVYYVKIKHLQF